MSSEITGKLLAGRIPLNTLWNVWKKKNDCSRKKILGIIAQSHTYHSNYTNWLADLSYFAWM